mmetsp:Transcript_17364/g.20702  ORF Transcript_17364/g.20702 Transcript_17364/m.20702 type:complete len:494 (-) Transcript_17364:134-1615(-)
MMRLGAISSSSSSRYHYYLSSTIRRAITTNGRGITKATIRSSVSTESSSPSSPSSPSSVLSHRIASRELTTGTTNTTTTSKQTIGGGYKIGSEQQLQTKHHPHHYQQQRQQQQNQQQYFSTLKDDNTEPSTTNTTTNTNTDKNNKSNNNEDTSSTDKTHESKDEQSFRETIEKLQGDDTTKNNNTTSSSDASSLLSSFTSTLSQTWNELLESSEPNDINKKIIDIQKSQPGQTTDDDHEAAEKYVGSTAIMVIDEDENMGAYERIQRRLSEAPIIQDVLKRSEQMYESSGAAKAKEKLSHVSEDAREAWETSQNPWVYRVSSVYDTLTAESEHGMTERELRELDPDFSLESWKNDVVEVTLPKLMTLILSGRIKELKPSLGESVYNRLAAESVVRKKEGVYVDTNVLGIMNADIIECRADTLNKGSPIITLHYMCQQINCTRKKKTGEIVEGGEDDIRAYSYVVAFQREYDEEKGELNWKVIDFMMNGAIAYL